MSLSSRGFGSAMIITGTSVGAGMLAIPATVAACGFWLASILLLVVWFVMLLSALLLVEVNLSMDSGSNFTTMAMKTLGRPAKLLTWLSYLLLLYSLTAAYTSGGGGLISSGLAALGFHPPIIICDIIFICIFGSAIYAGTFIVDQANKFLMLLKFLAFFAFVIAILPNLKLEFINGVGSRISYMWITFPILITSFSYHHIIPTLRIYTDSDKKTLHKAIFIGSVIPLFIYMLWILSTLGSIPLFGESSFHSILQSGDISSGIVSSYHSYLVGKFAYIFEAIAVTTSFLGVTLGLYHFNLDAYKLSSKKHGGRCIGFLITFIPALIYVICYPKGFIIALGYASFFCAILLIALPAAMAWSVRSKLGINNHRSKLYLSIMFGLAIFVMGLEICTLLGILPKLT